MSDSEKHKVLIEDIQSLLFNNGHAFSKEQLRGLLGTNEQDLNEALNVIVPGKSRNMASTSIRTSSSLFFHKRHKKPAQPPLNENDVVRPDKFSTTGKNWVVHRKRLVLSETVHANIAAREGGFKPHPLRVNKGPYPKK